MQTLEQLIHDLYPNDAKELITSLGSLFQTQPKLQAVAPDWYKKLQLYVTLPDAFGQDNKPGTLQTLADKLEYVRDLGANAVHILPFYESPMIDGGYDVSNYFAVRPELGGMDALAEFEARACDLNLSLFMDVTLNHVSFEHGWYQNAIGGDDYYRHYFIHSKTKPELVEKLDDDYGARACYQVFGSQVTIPIIFPDHVGDLPHWSQAKDGYWYFHTFYPHQPDVNWHNHQVFLEFAKVLVYWSRRGWNFRLDAVPHLDKEFHGFMPKNTRRNHELISALRHVVRLAHPQRVFLVEVIDHLDNVRSYLGSHQGEKAELAYNLHVMNGLWGALALGKPAHLWQALHETQQLPRTSQWVNFVRSHDAVMPGFVHGLDAKKLQKALVDKGKKFGKGLEVSGRLASLLDGDFKRIRLAHFLLASLPGNPAIFYADELGKTNDTEYMKDQAIQRRKQTGDEKLPEDARDMSRGIVNPSLYESKEAQALSEIVGQIFNKRLKYHFISTQTPVRVETEISRLFACEYQYLGKKLGVYANLTDQEVRLPIDEGSQLALGINDAKIENDELVLPGYAGAWIKSL